MTYPAVLSEGQCLELLYGAVIGRVGVNSPGGLRIVPVNYVVFEESIVWRTAPYSELATYGRDQEAAFEVDHIDHEKHQGWSVLATGRCEPVEDPETLDRIRATGDPQPWAGEQRQLYMRLRWRTLSGRLVGRDWTPETMTPVRRAP